MSTLEIEVNELKQRVARLESTVQQLFNTTSRQARPPAEMKAGESEAEMSREELRTWLKAEGIIIDPTPEMIALAQEWEDLSEEEKQTVRWELDHLPPGPLASDIIIENRR